MPPKKATPPDVRIVHANHEGGRGHHYTKGAVLPSLKSLAGILFAQSSSVGHRVGQCSLQLVKFLDCHHVDDESGRRVLLILRPPVDKEVYKDSGLLDLGCSKSDRVADVFSHHRYPGHLHVLNWKLFEQFPFQVWREGGSQEGERHWVCP